MLYLTKVSVSLLIVDYTVNQHTFIFLGKNPASSQAGFLPPIFTTRFQKLSQNVNIYLRFCFFTLQKDSLRMNV